MVSVHILRTKYAGRIMILCAKYAYMEAIQSTESEMLFDTEADRDRRLATGKIPSLCLCVTALPGPQLPGQRGASSPPTRGSLFISRTRCFRIIIMLPVLAIVRRLRPISVSLSISSALKQLHLRRESSISNHVGISMTVQLPFRAFTRASNADKPPLFAFYLPTRLSPILLFLPPADLFHGLSTLR